MKPTYTPVADINTWFNTEDMLACIINHCYCQWCEYVNASERGWLCVFLINIIIKETCAIYIFSAFNIKCVDVYKKEERS